MQVEKGLRLRLYMGESDRHGAQPLHEWLVKEGHKQGIAGCTVVRGIQGYGKHHQIHTANVLVLSAELPLIVEFIDTENNINNFLSHIDREVTHGYATIDDVQVCKYGSRDA